MRYADDTVHIDDIAEELKNSKTHLFECFMFGLIFKEQQTNLTTKPPDVKRTDIISIFDL